MTTDLKHDPEFPYVFRYSSGDKPNAKFRNKSDADLYAEQYAHGSVVDTTPPKPFEPGTVIQNIFNRGEDSATYVRTPTGWGAVYGDLSSDTFTLEWDSELRGRIERGSVKVIYGG